MSYIQFYNREQRQKKRFNPSVDGTVSIRYGVDKQLVENHINGLRQSLLLEMIETWFVSAGLQVHIHQSAIGAPHDIALTTNAQIQKTIKKDSAQHHVHLGEVEIPTLSVKKDDAYCAKYYIKTYGAEVIRFFLLRTHYRNNVQLTKLQLEDAKRVLERYYRNLKTVPPIDTPFDETNSYIKRIIEAMNDDFNVPKVVAALTALANQVAITRSGELSAQLKYAGSFLGILQDTPDGVLTKPAPKTGSSKAVKWAFMQTMCKAESKTKTIQNKNNPSIG